MAIIGHALFLAALSIPRAQADSVRQDWALSMYVLPDHERSVSRLIRASVGGELETVGSDGTVYRLSIPPDGLLADEVITLSPLLPDAIIEGVQAVGFSVEPDGVQLHNPATAFIKPASGNFISAGAKGSVLWSTERRDRSDLAVPALPSTAPFELRLLHFSGGGLALRPAGGSTPWGSLPADLKSLQAERLSAFTPQETLDVYSRIQRQALQDVASGAWRGPEQPSDYLRHLQDVIDQSRARVAEELADRGQWSDMKDVSDEISQLVQSERQRQLLGAAESSDAFGQQLYKIFSRYALSLAANCRSQLPDPRSILILDRQGQLLGYDTPDWQQAMRALHECIPDLTLDAAIERCRRIGDYPTLVAFYRNLLRTTDPLWAGSNVSDEARHIVSDARARTLQALRSCARFDYELSFESVAAGEVIIGTTGYDSTERETVRVSARGTLSYGLAFPYGVTDEVLDGSVFTKSGSAEIEECRLEIVEGGEDEYTIPGQATCEFKREEPVDYRYFDVRDLRFELDEISRLEFLWYAAPVIRFKLCWNRLRNGEPRCEDSDELITTLLDSCRRWDMTVADNRVQAVAGGSAWTARGNCQMQEYGVHVRDKYMLTLRHMGKN